MTGGTGAVYDFRVWFCILSNVSNGCSYLSLGSHLLNRISFRNSTSEIVILQHSFKEIVRICSSGGVIVEAIWNGHEGTLMVSLLVWDCTFAEFSWWQVVEGWRNVNVSNAVVILLIWIQAFDISVIWILCCGKMGGKFCLWGWLMSSFCLGLLWQCWIVFGNQ